MPLEEAEGMMGILDIITAMSCHQLDAQAHTQMLLKKQKMQCLAL